MLHLVISSYRRLGGLLAVLSAGLLFALMLITTIDVIGRYVFGNPLVGSTEMIEICLGLLIFAAIPLLCQNNDHVVVDLLENRFPAAFRKKRDTVLRLLTTVSLLTLSYGLLLLGKRAHRDELVSEILALPVAWFLFAMAILTLLAAGFSILRPNSSDTNA